MKKLIDFKKISRSDISKALKSFSSTDQQVFFDGIFADIYSEIDESTNPNPSLDFLKIFLDPNDLSLINSSFIGIDDEQQKYFIKRFINDDMIYLLVYLIMHQITNKEKYKKIFKEIYDEYDDENKRNIILKLFKANYLNFIEQMIAINYFDELKIIEIIKEFQVDEINSIVKVALNRYNKSFIKRLVNNHIITKEEIYKILSEFSNEDKLKFISKAFMNKDFKFINKLLEKNIIDESLLIKTINESKNNPNFKENILQYAIIDDNLLFLELIFQYNVLDGLNIDESISPYKEKLKARFNGLEESNIHIVDNLIKLQVIDRSVVLESFGKYDDLKKADIVKKALLLGKDDVVCLLKEEDLIDIQFIIQTISKCDDKDKIKIVINNIIFGNIDFAEEILREIISFPQIEISEDEKQTIFKKIFDNNKFFIAEKLFRLNLIKESDLKSYFSIIPLPITTIRDKSMILINQGNLYLFHLIEKLRIFIDIDYDKKFKTLNIDQQKLIIKKAIDNGNILFVVKFLISSGLIDRRIVLEIFSTYQDHFKKIFISDALREKHFDYVGCKNNLTFVIELLASNPPLILEIIANCDDDIKKIIAFYAMNNPSEQLFLNLLKDLLQAEKINNSIICQNYKEIKDKLFFIKSLKEILTETIKITSLIDFLMLSKNYEILEDIIEMPKGLFEEEIDLSSLTQLFKDLLKTEYDKNFLHF